MKDIKLTNTVMISKKSDFHLELLDKIVKACSNKSSMDSKCFNMLYVFTNNSFEQNTYGT